MMINAWWSGRVVGQACRVGLVLLLRGLLRLKFCIAAYQLLSCMTDFGKSLTMFRTRSKLQAPNLQWLCMYFEVL